MKMRTLIIVLLLSSGLPLLSQTSPILQRLSECQAAGRSNCDSIFINELNALESKQEDSAYFAFLLETSSSLITSGYLDLAIFCVHRAASQAYANSDTLNLAKALSKLSTIYVYEGSLDSAEYYALKALEYHQIFQDSFKIAVGTIKLGQIQKEKGMYEASMASYLEGLTMFDDLNNQLYIAHTENEIATLYAMTDEVERAVSFGLKAVKAYRIAGDKYYEAYAKLNLANNLIYLGREDTAIMLLDEVIPVFKEAERVYMLMNAEAQYGRALFRIGKFEEALTHFNRSLKLDPDENFVAQSAYNHEFLSRMFRETGKLDQAVIHSRKSLALHERMGWNEELKNALNDMAINYEALSQSDSALKYYKEFMAISDSLYSLRNTEQLNELKSRYESDLKEQKIVASQAEINLLQEKNRNKTQRNTALIVAILAVSGLAVSVILQQRKAHKLSGELARENERSLQAELRAKKEEQERLQAELDYKKRNLASQALLIAEKNELLRSFKDELSELPDQYKSSNEITSVVNRMERVENQNRDWDKFMAIFNEVHPDFHQRLREKHPQLSSNDLRLSSLMRMNFTNKEMASILHISEAGLKKARYRLRKKMELESESDIAQYIFEV